MTAPASTPLADAAGCLTLRDAELGCARSCGSLSSALSGCAGHAPGAQGRIVVDWWREGTSPVRYRIRAEGELMMPVTACVDRVFRRFEPCQEGDASGSVPLVIAPGRAGDPLTGQFYAAWGDNIASIRPPARGSTSGAPR